MKLKLKQSGGPATNQVIVEAGEIGRDLQGNLVQIDSQAPSHDDPRLIHSGGVNYARPGKGGVLTDQLKSILSDSQTQINRGERSQNPADAQIAISGKQANQLGKELGLPVKIRGSISPSKLFLSLQTARDKMAKKYVLKPKHQQLSGKAFQTSQHVNALQQQQLPDDQALYNLVFGMQEAMKKPEPVATAVMQQGGRVKLSTQGYKRNSPDKHEPALVIPSNQITMDGVDHDILLYGDGGEVIHATPDKDYYLPNSSQVLEIPLGQQGYHRPSVSNGQRDPVTGRVLFPADGPLPVIGKPGQFDYSQSAIDQWATGTLPAPVKPAPVKKTAGKLNPKTRGVNRPTPTRPVTRQAQAAGLSKTDYSAFLPDPSGDPTVPLVAPQTYAPGQIQADSLERTMTPVRTESGVPVQSIVAGEPIISSLDSRVAERRPGQKYVDELNPFRPRSEQFMGDLYNLLDAQTRQPGYLQQMDYVPLHLDRVNPTASRQAIQDAYQAANQSIPDPGTQIGRAQQVAQYSSYLDSLNQLNGQIDGQNVQIGNQENQYNQAARQQIESQNAQLRDQFYVRDLQTEEARRQQTSASLNSITGKLSQARQQMANYDLFKSAFAPRYKVNGDGKLVLDSSAPPVQFGQKAVPASPNELTTTETTLDKDGKPVKTRITKKELDFLTQNRGILQRLGQLGALKAIY
ncbi:hypothetical protein CLV58_109181 [Spirosoma oryzae]|uniref:Uncharacterized protein n=1 Tax=Spirosoma oryzae TaxID=1469603 RepID=A0A2T0SYH4_9BACT|nr:hypothetical protein [Spirosoma oryzae]PRY38454.1 hypothetical protein CLV58_109181 [Spirosoma oryzae]